MTINPTFSSLYSRAQWMTILACARSSELDEQWACLEHPKFTWLKRPELGTTMMRARASGTGTIFNLADITVTRCSLQLQTGEIGIAYVAGRSKRHAGLAALFDAMMQREEREGAGSVTASVAALAAATERRKQAVVQEAVDTKVDFFMLSREGDGA